MSEQTAQEPTMEEILASIRRIISEDDQPGEAKADAPAEAAAEAEVEESPAMMDETPSMQAEEEVLELTERVEEPARPEPVQTIGDIEAAPRYEPEPAPEPAPAYAAPTPQFQMGAAAAASGSLGGNPTIEELVRSILEPQIREWVAQNLDDIMRDVTKEMVREKLERVFK